MSERELDHLLDLCQLLPATSDVVVSDCVERVLFLFTLDRLALAMDDSVGSDNAKGSWICFNNLNKGKLITCLGLRGFYIKCFFILVLYQFFQFSSIKISWGIRKETHHSISKKMYLNIVIQGSRK